MKSKREAVEIAKRDSERTDGSLEGNLERTSRSGDRSPPTACCVSGSPRGLGARWRAGLSGSPSSGIADEFEAGGTDEAVWRGAAGP